MPTFFAELIQYLDWPGNLVAAVKQTAIAIQSLLMALSMT